MAKGHAAFFVLQKDAKKTPKGRQANFVLHLVGNHFWTPKGRLCKKDGKKSWHLHLNVSDKTLEQQRLSFVSNVCHLEDFSCCRFFVILLVPKWNFLFHIFKLCWASHRVPKPLAVAAEMAANSPRHWGRWMWPQPYTTGIQYIIIVREPKISGTIPPRGLKFWLQVALSAPIATPWT